VSAHRKAAEELLAEAVLSKTGSDVESSRQVQALVHATLEVAAQLRVANLIALGMYKTADDYRPFEHFVDDANSAYSGPLDPELQEELS